jgi:octanoyl-[GcvH]:protein N-octanoyltransferase
VRLLTDGHPTEPEVDMARSEDLLRAVAQREAPETVRIYRPGPTVAFGRAEVRRPGYSAAQGLARARGYVPVVRLGGGQAAIYDRDCVIAEVVRGQTGIIGGLDERYADLADLLTGALGVMGTPVQVGELPGEYCPGRFSLHLPEGPKVAGIAQRVVSGASLTTAVLVVNGGERLREAVRAIYAALATPVDPSVAGALTDRHPGARAEAVARRLAAAARTRYAITE